MMLTIKCHASITQSCYTIYKLCISQEDKTNDYQRITDRIDGPDRRRTAGQMDGGMQMITVYHSAFSTAERHFKAILNRIEYYNDMSTFCAETDRHLDAKVYSQLMTGHIDTACDLVDLCYYMEFITRSEAYNIKHWLYWYDDPNRLDPEYYFFEDFRHE